MIQAYKSAAWHGSEILKHNLRKKWHNSLAGKSTHLPSHRLGVQFPLGQTLWLFSRPSALENVYLHWLGWPHKWWRRLTDLEWDVKEPLRTSSLAVITLNVPKGLSLGLQWNQVLLYALLHYPRSSDQHKHKRQKQKKWYIWWRAPLSPT